jgi:hypothetical protein
MDLRDFGQTLDEIAANEDLSALKTAGHDEHTKKFDQLTQAQEDAIDAAEKVTSAKEHGQLFCTLWHPGSAPKPLLTLSWQGHENTQGAIYSKDTDAGFVKLLHESFGKLCAHINV